MSALPPELRQKILDYLPRYPSKQAVTLPALHLVQDALRCVPLDAIREIASRRNLRVLEDAAQAHGAHYRGRRVGSLAHAAVFSFYPTKNLSACGEGGVLTTDDDQIAKYAAAARNHGQTARCEHEFVWILGIWRSLISARIGRRGRWF